MKKKKASRGSTKSKMTHDVMTILEKEAPKQLNHKQIAGRIGIRDKHSRRMVVEILSELHQQGRILEKGRGRYLANIDLPTVKGTLEMTRKGVGFVQVNGVDKDIFITEKNLGRALHGDEVELMIYPAKRGKRGPEGKIIQVIERSRTDFVGTLQVGEPNAFLIPDSAKMNVDIFIPQSKLKDGKHGQKALVRLGDWPEEAGCPFGEVIEILGEPGDIPVEMNSILAEYGFPLEFPKAVEEEAASIPVEISQEEIDKRWDFRDVLTFTIDPADAKDFDDALSIRKLENGNWEVGVHIADVTHYVKTGTQLEKEARKRATSVYLVDRVIPMLPEVLSNNLCSLRPNEDKLTFAAVFELDEDVKVKRHWIGRTVIHSDRRFTYEEVQEILEGAEGQFAEELNVLNDMAKAMRDRRIDQGAIAFERTEVRFKLDDSGQPADIYFKVQKDAHKLIEEFMLLANRTVAEEYGKKKPGLDQVKTFVYRVHDHPDPEKLSDFVQFISKFGHRLGSQAPGKLSQSMNKLLQQIRGTGEQDVIETLAIRTMAKALYSTENVGHYGLGFRYYSHFTSPIRRYPDMIAHRLLATYQSGGKSVKEDYIEGLCKHSSDMERQAEAAERESTKFFQVLYMKDSQGKRFRGVVSGVSEWGIFVEIIENKCEGMIRMRDLSGDYYYFDEKNYRVLGSNYGRVIQLGDEITIQVLDVDLVNKRLDFALVQDGMNDED